MATDKAGEQSAGVCPTCNSGRKSTRRKIFTPTEEAWCFDEWHKAERVAAPPEPATPRLNFQRPVSAERAKEAAIRLINSHFNNNRETHPHARMTIPANQDDDDIVLCDFISQAQAKVGTLEQALRTAREYIKAMQELIDGEETPERLQRTLDAYAKWAALSGESRQ